MAILHDNRNMRPDLLDKPEENVDDIFAAADAQMKEQQQKRLFTPNLKKIKWKKRLKRTAIWSIVFVVLVLLGLGVFAVRMSYITFKSEVKIQTLESVRELKNTIDSKSESELTQEERLARDIFKIVTEEDIANMLDTATSVEELITVFRTQTIDINNYLTLEQQRALEQLMLTYAEDLNKRAEEMEASLAAEETASSDLLDETNPIVEPTNDSDTSTENMEKNPSE